MQQSLESIEAKHMQNAWKPVKGYLHNKKGTRFMTLSERTYQNIMIQLSFKSVEL